MRTGMHSPPVAPCLIVSRHAVPTAIQRLGELLLKFEARRATTALQTQDGKAYQSVGHAHLQFPCGRIGQRREPAAGDVVFVPERIGRLPFAGPSGSAVLASLAGWEATYHKALIASIDVDSHTAQTAGSPAAQITMNITGANGKLAAARNRTRGRYRCTSKDKYRASTPKNPYRRETARAKYTKSAPPGHGPSPPDSYAAFIQLSGNAAPANASRSRTDVARSTSTNQGDGADTALPPENSYWVKIFTLSQDVQVPPSSPLTV